MLRPVVHSDSDALIDIAVATGLFDRLDAQSLLGETLSALHAGALGEGHAAVAWAPPGGEAPVGWCYFAPDDHAAGVWNLWWIGVRPDAHGHGGGDALLDTVETAAIAAGGRLLIIETSATPPLARARSFYTRRGYATCGRVPDFYGSGDDKVIFAKALVSADSRDSTATHASDAA